MSNYSSSSGWGADWLVGVVKRNPEGLLLLAAGCALLLRSGGPAGRTQPMTHPGARDFRDRQWESSRYDARGGRASDRDWGVSERVSRAADDAREYASETGRTVSETAGQYASAISDTAGRYASKVSDTADRYVSAVGDYAEDARQTIAEQSGRLAQQAQSTVERIVREQPLAVALAGLAAGAAVAAAFPATSIERRTLGPAGERLSDAAEIRRRKARRGSVGGGRAAEGRRGAAWLEYGRPEGGGARRRRRLPRVLRRRARRRGLLRARPNRTGRERLAAALGLDRFERRH